MNSLEKFINDLVKPFEAFLHTQETLEQKEIEKERNFQEQNKQLIEEANRTKELFNEKLEELNNLLHQETLTTGSKSHLDGSFRVSFRESIDWNETDEEELFHHLVINHPELLTLPKSGTPEFINVLTYVRSTRPELLVIDKNLVSKSTKTIDLPGIVLVKKLTNVSEKIFHRVLFNRLDEMRWNESRKDK